MATLTEDHAVCREVLAASGSSFAMPIRLLPAGKRQAMTALYAFCRRADDITDGPQDAAASPAAAELQRARDELTAFRNPGPP